MRRRSQQDELPLVRAALAGGDFDTAFRILDQALLARRPRSEAVRLNLQLASLHLLFGDESADEAETALRNVLRFDRSSGDTPLFQALYWELQALHGARPREVRRAMRLLRTSADAQAHYHAANALVLAGSNRGALLHLDLAISAGLPHHLLWRSHSLLGVVHEQLGEFREAADAIERAITHCSGADQQAERIALAVCLLELGETSEAAAALDAIDDTMLGQLEDHVHKAHLRGRIEAEQGNPGLALQYYRSARFMLRDAAAPDYDEYALALAEAQLNADLGRYQEAVSAYREALSLAGPERLTQARHELAVALIDSGGSEAAISELEIVLADQDYPYRPEAMAELADLHFRQGDNDVAEHLAQAALDLRPVAAAYLTLGAIAYDYYRLADAVTWFEKALAAAEEGDPYWVAAQQLLADVFANMGPEKADRLYQHASTALRYTDRRNDWYLPLRAHQEAAQRNLVLRERMVN